MPIGLPNCSRVRACSTPISRTRWAMPTDSSASAAKPRSADGRRDLRVADRDHLVYELVCRAQPSRRRRRCSWLPRRRAAPAGPSRAPAARARPSSRTAPGSRPGRTPRRSPPRRSDRGRTRPPTRGPRPRSSRAWPARAIQSDPTRRPRGNARRDNAVRRALTSPVLR